MIDPFSLFCLYHLGLDVTATPAVKSRMETARGVARKLGCSVDDVDHALATHHLSAAHLLERDFDLVGAQLDIAVSPPGVDLRGIALMHWELFQNAATRPRDWDAERRADEAENRRTYGGGDDDA